MSFLENKSGISLAAADVLQRNFLYSSAVHCAYYSCIQLMKHIMINKKGYTERSIYKECKENYEGKTHEHLINYFVTLLKNLGKDWNTFNSDINSLKKLRVDADYKDISIDSPKSAHSITLSSSLLRTLKSI